MDTTIVGTIEELEANRAMFTALVRCCPTHPLDRPVPESAWRVRDYLAHLAAADQIAAVYLRAARSGESGAAATQGRNLDQWNETEVRQRAGRSIPVLLAEMESRREQSVALLAELADADLDHEIYFPGDARRSPGPILLRLWLQAWSKHDLLHARDLLRALPSLAANADFQAWLAEDPLVDAIDRLS